MRACFQMGSFRLRQVAGQLGLVETLLDLVVYESDESIVLFAQLLLEDAVVLLSNLLVLFLKGSNKKKALRSSVYEYLSGQEGIQE